MEQELQTLPVRQQAQTQTKQQLQQQDPKQELHNKLLPFETIKNKTETEEESNIHNQEIPIHQTSSTMQHNVLVAIYILYTIIVGYTVSTQPTGAGWRYFSWHPFLMVTGFITMMGVSALIKKKGGYVNTKLHGMISSAGTFMVFGGLYVIYQHKESIGKDHVTTTHAIFGIVTVACCVMAMMAGGVFLHPDFGFDKTNKTIR